MVIIKTIFLLLLSLVLATTGSLLPVQLRSLDKAALLTAAEQDSSIKDALSDSLNAAHTGPARWIIDGTDAKESQQEATIQRLYQRNPSLQLSGGPDPILEEFLQIIPQRKAQPDQTTPIVSLLLPRNERQALAEILDKSNNANVGTLLSIRNLTGLTKLHPADHAAGAPYDTAVLTLALLIKGGHFDPTFASRIGDIATQSALGQTEAIRIIEEMAMATLSLGRQLDYRSLANLAEFTDSVSTWAEMATLFRIQPNRVAELYTALHFQQTCSPIFNYLSANSETANKDIDFALREGPGSLDHLLTEALPIYEPAPTTGSFLKLITPLRPTSFTQFAISDRPIALATKAILFVTAGLFFAFAMGTLWRSNSKAAINIRRFAPPVIARNLLTSFVFAICLWILIEPAVLQSSSSEIDTAPRIEFAVASVLEPLQSPAKAMQELNQITLLILVLFFIIQLVIYCFCLIKLKEISKQSLNAKMKLKLLDNEENLFDFGLYVGLGGTVLSFILLALKIVEASLLAAYASTLFGVLFVAILKVIHLRPFRRNLILEAGRTKNNTANSTEEPNLMGDIKL